MSTASCRVCVCLCVWLHTSSCPPLTPLGGASSGRLLPCVPGGTARAAATSAACVDLGEGHRAGEGRADSCGRREAVCRRLRGALWACRVFASGEQHLAKLAAYHLLILTTVKLTSLDEALMMSAPRQLPPRAPSPLDPATQTLVAASTPKEHYWRRSSLCARTNNEPGSRCMHQQGCGAHCTPCHPPGTPHSAATLLCSDCLPQACCCREHMQQPALALAC